ncbi:MAG: hypothetical protein GX602_02530, partial [Dehalococcoidales bacterium]|nr:hypothetical protein [Dehalococcoidales bacterium]
MNNTNHEFRAKIRINGFHSSAFNSSHFTVHVFSSKITMMDLIYCAGGNTKLAKIAIEEGFLYGSRSDDIRDVHCNGLIDIKWENYDWIDHVCKVKSHRPKYAVVPDILSVDKLPHALSKAEELEPYCGKVIIVPKVHGLISQIPN